MDYGCVDGSGGSRFAFTSVKRYREDPGSLAALVREDAVHRDVYIDADVFDIECDRLWSRTWIYIGHDSEVPMSGDHRAVDCAGRRLVLRRDPGGSVHVDGAAEVAIHRGFVFARRVAGGPDFAGWASGMLAVLDNVADRSPTGRLQVAGPPIRSLVHANWKMYLENINDTVHPVSTHESVSSSAQSVWSAHGVAGTPPPLTMQQLLPFGAGYAFYEQMGARVLPAGHSVLGTRKSLHSGYDGLDGYEASLRAAHGAVRVAEVLGFAPQNAVFYPSLSVKAMPTALRVVRPLAVDRTLIEAWSFQPVGAPDLLARRAQTYNRLVFSPMSVLAHDDLHVFASIQSSLKASGNEWVSLHRRCLRNVPEDGDGEDAAAEVGGTDERLMRNQFRAWRRAMRSDRT